MPLMLQKKLMEHLMIPLSRLTERIPLSIRNLLFSFSLTCQICLSFVFGAGKFSRYLYLYAPSCLFLGIMILAGLRSDMRALRFSRLFMICWYGITAFMLLTAVLVDHDKFTYVMLWLIALPIFYVVWGNRGFSELMPLVIRGVYASFLIFLLISVFRYPVQGSNYASFYANRNSLSTYALGVFSCCVVDLLSQGKFSFRTILAGVFSGVSVSLAIYSSGRCGQASIAVCFLASFLFCFIVRKKAWKAVLLHQLLPVVLIIAVSVPGTIAVFNLGYELMHQSSVQGPSEPVGQTPSVQDTLDDILETTNKRGSLDGRSLNKYTSGRLELWGIYLPEVGFLGNPQGKQMFFAEDSVFWPGKPVKLSSHCVVIQMAYDFGALAGLLFLAFNLIFGIRSIVFGGQRKEDLFALAPFSLSVAYGALSVVELVYDPFVTLMTFLYFMAQLPLLTDQDAVRAEIASVK